MSLPPVGSPCANGEHPRMHLVASDLSSIRDKILNHYVYEYAALVSLADSLYTTLDKPNGYQGWGVDIIAFVGMIGEIGDTDVVLSHTPAEYKQRALSYCEDIVDGVYNPGVYDGDFGYYPMSTRQCMARALDWAYDEATSAQIAKIAGWLADEIPDMITANRAEAGLFSSPFAEREAAWYIAAAIWGEEELTTDQEGHAQDGLDEFTIEMINSGDGRLVGLQWVARENGGYSEIGSYDNHQRRLLLEIDGWRTSLGQNYFVDDAYTGYPAYWLQGIPKLYAYILQPYPDYRILLIGQRDGDSKGLNDYAYSSHQARVVGWSSGLCEASGYTNMAGLARWLVNKGEGELDGDYSYAYWAWILFSQKALSYSPDDLSLAKYCHFEGLGVYVARTGWTDEKDTVIAMCGYPNILYGHTWGPLSHDRPRGLHLSKYGPLIHGREAYLRSSSGQRPAEVIFTDEATLRESLWDNSRTYGNNDTQLSSYLDDTGRYVEGIKRTKSTDDYHHVFVQHKDAYKSAVANYSRTYVVIFGATTSKPDFIFIMDRTETKLSDDGTAGDSIRKRWSVGTSWRPTCNGTENVTVGSDNPHGFNIADYTGHSGHATIEIKNRPPGGNGHAEGTDPYNGISYPLARGMAYISCVEPSAVKVYVRGGPGPGNQTDGENGYENYIDGYEFWDDGVFETTTPYVPPTSKDGSSAQDSKEDDYSHMTTTVGGGMFCGSFCVEIEPVTNAAEINFLTVIQVGHDSDAKRTVNKVEDETNGFIGIHIEDATEGDRVVLFSSTETDGASKKTAASYSISGAGSTCRHVLTDFEAGTYTVKRDGTAFTTATVEEDGSMTFEGAGSHDWSIESGDESELSGTKMLVVAR